MASARRNETKPTVGLRWTGIPESKGPMAEVGEAVQGELADEDAENAASSGEE